MNRAAVVGLLLSMSAGEASAHPLDVATARVSLRDGHIEVLAELDLFAALRIDPTSVATASDEALTAAHSGFVRLMESESSLEADGSRIALRARGVPSAAELRAMAATLSSRGETHGPLVRFFLDGATNSLEPRTVAFRPPAVLGPVIVSFVQPSSTLVRPGETARFSVLGLRREGRSGWGIPDVLLLFSAVTIVAGRIYSRRILE